MTDLLGVTNQFLAWELPLERQMERIADMGFQYLEIMTPLANTYPPDMDSKRRSELRQTISSAGLKTYTLSPSYADLNLVSVNVGLRKEAVKQIKENIDLARDLDVKYVIVIPGKRYQSTLCPSMLLGAFR